MLREGKGKAGLTPGRRVVDGLSVQPARGLVVASLFAVGCGGAALPSTAPMTPLVPLEQSPSQGERFTFCAEPPPDIPLQLTNLLWLSFFSANEYAHAMVVGPMLNRLGFENPDAPMDREWATCESDLRRLRAAEAPREDEIASALGTPRLRELGQSLVPAGVDWGTCASGFLNSDAFGQSSMPSAAFQDWLVHRPVEGRYLQFFSGRGTGKKWFEDGSTQVVFARHKVEPIVIIAFRGTEPREMVDVRLDLKVWRTGLEGHGWPAGWGGVHSGFYDGFAEVEPLLVAKLRELSGTGARIWVTGHSLGGALATITAARILRAIDEGADLRLGGLVTFGSPRVGDHAFASALSSRARERGVPIVRVRNENDAVTAIPSEVLGFEHVGRLVHLHEDRLDLVAAPDAAYGPLSIADHSSSGFVNGKPQTGYYRRLEKARASGVYAGFDQCPANTVSASR